MIETNSNPPSNSKEWMDFLTKWGIRAEQGVKVAKRLIRENTGRGGDLNTNEVTRVLLQYLNTPFRGLLEFPAQIVFGRPITDPSSGGMEEFEQWPQAAQREGGQQLKGHAV